MKQFFLCNLIGLSFICLAQTPYVHPTLISVSVVENDFKNKFPLKKSGNLNAGLSIAFIKAINQRFDWQLSYTGSFPDSFSKKTTNVKENLLSELEVNIRTRLFAHHAGLQPYLLTGVGTDFIQNRLSAHMVIGPGIQWNFKEVYIQLNTLYKPSLAGTLNHHFSYGLGVGGSINMPNGKKKKQPSKATPPNLKIAAKDTDGDGIIDSLDQCPIVPGLLAFNGCPDTDKDGLPDIKDKCPTVFGKEKYEGCPAPDTDCDGINDEADSCIAVAGVVKNHGCPEIVKTVIQSLDLAANRIYFETGKAILLPQSFAALDTVVKILRHYPLQRLSVEGHTDDIGKVEANLLLSVDRAKAVVSYLVAKGIDAVRLSHKGFGAARPVADNSIPEGRARNRRVELKLAN